MNRCTPLIRSAGPCAARFLVFAAALAAAYAPPAAALTRPVHARVDAPPAAYVCISKPCDTRELGFSTRGTISEVLVKPGDPVDAGAPIVRLDDAVQARYVELAAIAAEDDSALRLAERTLAFRQEEMKAIEAARAQVAGNAAEVREARYRLETSELELAAAKARQDSSRVTLERERARLAEMRIASPIDATVIEVHKRAGETVDQGTTVVTLVSIDPLWVEVNVPTAAAMDIPVGAPAVVTWEDVKGIEPMRGKVIYRSPVAHAGARQVQFRVELANPARIPSGMHGAVRFEEAPQAKK